MANREPIHSPSLDQQIFSRTAKKTKRINVAPKIMRGGIRL